MKKSMIYLLLSAALSLSAVTAYANHHEGGEMENHHMQADVNNDGKISYEEFKAVSEKHFKRKDVNGDGFIDEAEKKAARENRKAHHDACTRKNDKD